MQVALTWLRTRIEETLRKNFSKKDASQIAEYLLWAEMSGNKTQGILKLAGTEPLQEIKPQGKITVEKETKLSQIIDARANPAILAASAAVLAAIKKAKKHGAGFIGIRNTFSSNGAQAYYVEKIAKEGLIGIMCSRSPSSTAAFGSIEPLFGTNPIGVAFPTKNTPIVFDMATSAMTWYGLVLAKARGERIPEDVAIDAAGEPTTDPAAAMQGALLPFDRGYKGAGISMVVEVLAGPLVGTSFIDNKTFKEEWGTLIIAIDPELLTDAEKFKADCSEMIRRIKGSRKKEEMRLPGERARACHEKALKTGKVDVDDAVLRELGYI